MKQANLQLATWYNTLPRNEYRQARDELIKQCGITRAVFYNWLQGITPVPSYQYDAINRAAGKEIMPKKEIGMPWTTK